MIKRGRCLFLLLVVAFLLASAIVACGEPIPTPSPEISVSSSSFSLNVREGESNLSSLILGIWNSGGGILNWSVSDDASWLSLSPTSGSSTGEVDDVTLLLNIFGMTAGNCVAIIAISASGVSSSPETVIINLAINPSPVEEEEQEQIINALDTELLLDIGYDYPEGIVTVEGFIVRTYYAQKSRGKPTFLDFHDPYEGYFKCVIWEEDKQSPERIRDNFIEAFPPDPGTYFLNKKVRVEGSIVIYHGDPEIILSDPSQIWVVE